MKCITKGGNEPSNLFPVYARNKIFESVFFSSDEGGGTRVGCGGTEKVLLYEGLDTGKGQYSLLRVRTWPPFESSRRDCPQAARQTFRPKQGAHTTLLGTLQKGPGHNDGVLVPPAKKLPAPVQRNGRRVLWDPPVRSRPLVARGRDVSDS